METQWQVIFPHQSIDDVLTCYLESELLNPTPRAPAVEAKPSPVSPPRPKTDTDFQMTEEEERELAELLDSD